MKKIIVFLVSSIIILFAFCGCIQQKEPELLNGCYMLSEYKGVYMSPIITFYAEKSTFSFHYDYLSSYYAYGNFTVNGNRIIAETDDEKYTFVFEIKDDETIIFIQDSSSEIRIIDKKAPQIIDGSEFKLQEQ